MVGQAKVESVVTIPMPAERIQIIPRIHGKRTRDGQAWDEIPNALAADES